MVETQVYVYLCAECCSEGEIAFVGSLTSPWSYSSQRFVISIRTANSLGPCVKPRYSEPNGT